MYVGVSFVVSFVVVPFVSAHNYYRKLLAQNPTICSMERRSEPRYPFRHHLFSERGLTMKNARGIVQNVIELPGLIVQVRIEPTWVNTYAFKVIAVYVCTPEVFDELYPTDSAVDSACNDIVNEYAPMLAMTSADTFAEMGLSRDTPFEVLVGIVRLDSLEDME